MSSTSYSSTLFSASTADVTSSATASTSTHTHDERTLILGVTLGVVGFLLVIVIIVATFRFQRAKPGDSKSFSLRATVIDRSHPAARITPFGAPGGEIPRFGFAHNPGSNMRIATRRADGAWQFSNSRTPFTPSGVSDLDLSPSSPSTSVRSPQPMTKEQESKMAALERERYKGDDDYDMEPGPDVVPPPAYGYEPGYINHMKT